jgi:hypothetical protein
MKITPLEISCAPVQLLEVAARMIWLVVTFLLVALSPACADWINLTGAETAPNIAEIRVLEDRVNVRFEVYIGNLEPFADLIPDELMKNAGEGRPTEGERLEHFAKEVLSILGPDGAALPAELKLVEPRLRVDRKSPFAGMINPQTRRRVPEAPTDKRVLFDELDYLFDGRPDALTISPPSDTNKDAVVTIGFIAYHKAVPIIDFRYLSKATQLRLDWDDPWYSQFDNPNLKRHHKNPLMSFVYVEPRQIRHEVLVRVRDLQDWTDLGLSGGATIGIEEQVQLKQRALAFFATRNPLQIDGAPSKPTTSRAEFLNLSISGVQVIEEAEPLDLSTAIIGVTQSYPVSHLPQKVDVEWELFNERISRIPATATDPAGPFRTFVDAENPTIEWQNFLFKYVEPQVVPVQVDSWRSFGLPIASLALSLGALLGIALAVRPSYLSRAIWAGVSFVCLVAAILLMRVAVFDVRIPFAGLPDDAVSAKIINSVLDNVHIAYPEAAVPELERALSVVVAEDGFESIKAELDRALAIKVAGGGIARVTAIEDLVIQDVTALDDGPGFRSVAEWTALASAGHWGHPHRRRIRFRALMELGEVEGTWKLSGMTVVGARQES